MKQYHSITGRVVNTKVYVFDKLDGSNIRGTWSKKRGFYKFGTRTQMLDENYEHPFLGEAPLLIIQKYEDDISKVMKKNRIDQATFFFEFFGKSSFAGFHFVEPHDVVLFDVNIYKKGILGPGAFLDLFGHLDVPRVLHYGNPTKEFIESVKNGTLDGMTFEGVVCKAANKKKPGLPHMFKIKNIAWIEKLKTRCGKDEALFEKLA